MKKESFYKKNKITKKYRNFMNHMIVIIRRVDSLLKCKFAKFLAFWNWALCESDFSSLTAYMLNFCDIETNLKLQHTLGI